MFKLCLKSLKKNDKKVFRTHCDLGPSDLGRSIFLKNETFLVNFQLFLRSGVFFSSAIFCPFSSPWWVQLPIRHFSPCQSKKSFDKWVRGIWLIRSVDQHLELSIAFGINLCRVVVNKVHLVLNWRSIKKVFFSFCRVGRDQSVQKTSICLLCVVTHYSKKYNLVRFFFFFSNRKFRIFSLKSLRQKWIFKISFRTQLLLSEQCVLYVFTHYSKYFYFVRKGFFK